MLNTHFEKTLEMCNALTIIINDNNMKDTANKITRTKTKKRGTCKQQQQKPIRKLLPADFTPKSSDILCGRGNVFSGHEGNQYFGGFVRSNLRKYVEAPSRSEKIRVVDEIHREIKTSGVRFVKVDSETQRWYELNDVQAHQKIGHAIRDTIRLLEKDRPKRNTTNNNNNNNNNNNKPKTLEQKTKSLAPSSKPFTAAKQKFLEDRREIRRINSTMPNMDFGRSTSESPTDTIQELILQGIRTEDIYELFLGNSHDDSSLQQQQQQQQQQTQYEHQQYQPIVFTPTPTPSPSYSRTGLTPFQNRSRYLLENEYPETEYHYSPSSFFGDNAFTTQIIHID